MQLKLIGRIGCHYFVVLHLKDWREDELFRVELLAQYCPRDRLHFFAALLAVDMLSYVGFLSFVLGET